MQLTSQSSDRSPIEDSSNWIEDAIVALEQGQVLCEQKRWNEAVPCYQRAMELFEPGAAITYRMLGWALQEQGSLMEAEAFYNKALAIQPDLAEVHARLGSLYAAQERWQEAIACYQTAIDLDSQFVGAYLKLGEAWQAAGEPTQAVLSLFQASQLSPDMFSAVEHWQLGTTLVQHHQFEAAQSVFRTALMQDAHQPQVWLSLTNLLEKQGQTQEAIACYLEAIARMPDYPTFYTQLGNLLTQCGQVLEALTLHRQAGVLRGWERASTANYQFSYDWFTHNLPHWWMHLQVYAHQPNVQFLEIGSYEGMSACWLLDHILTHPSARLTTIDPAYQSSFDFNLEKTGSREKVTKLTGNSHDLLPALAPEIYDVIYIDGCHLAQHVQRDAALSWKLLKPGGLMIFDDYLWSDPNYPNENPKLGIDEFLISISEQYERSHQMYQLMIRKKI